MRFGGLGGLGVILIVNIMERIAAKLCRTILLHLGLITFRTHYWKTRKPLICMVLGPGGRDNDSQNQLLLFNFGYTKVLKTKTAKNTESLLGDSVSGNYRILEIAKFEKMRSEKSLSLGLSNS